MIRLRTLAVVALLVVSGCAMGLDACADVELGCTDGKRHIVFGAQWLAQATDDEIALVALHEAGHIALRHRKSWSNRREQELAADRWALEMLKADIETCRLARLLIERERPARAAVLCGNSE